MRAGVLCDVGRIELRDVPRPRAGPRDVLLRIAAVGLCGTDFHIFAGHANYHTDRHGVPVPIAAHPQILGHEITGLIEEIGRDVTDLRDGDRVIVDQGINCQSVGRTPPCEYCATGDSHQCEGYAEHGITGLPGGLAEYLAIPAANAVRITTPLDPVEAALAEPLGCILHASDMVARAHHHARYAIEANETARRVHSILICGAGPAGLLFTQYLRNVLGYDGRLLVSEPNSRKRELAVRFGAEVIDPRATDLVEAVEDATGGRRVEYLIEASGAGQIFTLIPGLIRKQATVLLYGHGHAGVDLSVLNNVMYREPTLITPVGASGGFHTDGRPSTYRRALELIEEGRIDVASFITHRYESLAAVPDAFATNHLTPDYVKGVVIL